MTSGCMVMKMRWSDAKAQKVFRKKDIPLSIRDTIISNRHIHYALSGPDTLPTLVFIHGSPGSWMHYHQYLADSLLRSKYRLVAIDRPGYGHSNFGKAMALKAQAELLLPVVTSLKTDQPLFLCGHSMGGPVVVQLAAMAPETFQTIVVVAGALDARQEKPEIWRKIMQVKPLYWLLPGAFGPSNTELLYLKKDLIPLQQEFEKITCGVHFVHGTKDTWVPFENVAFGVQNLKNASFIKVDTLVGADHQIPWKNYQVLRNVLLEID